MGSLKDLFGMTEYPYGMSEYRFGRWMVLLMLLQQIPHEEVARTFRKPVKFITAIANQDIVPSDDLTEEIVEHYAEPYRLAEEAESKRCRRCGSALS
jgi:hypothetical protein